MVDALLADKPVIAMLVDEYRDTNASQTVHFRYLLEADVYMRARTPDMCAELVGLILDGSDPKKDKRRSFAREFVRPHGLARRAGDVAATAIVMAAEGKTSAEINAEIARTGPGEGGPIGSGIEAETARRGDVGAIVR